MKKHMQWELFTLAPLILLFVYTPVNAYLICNTVDASGKLFGRIVGICIDIAIDTIKFPLMHPVMAFQIAINQTFSWRS